MIRKNDIVLYLALHILGQYIVHASAKYRAILFFLIIQPLFPSFYTTLPSNPLCDQLSHRECFLFLVLI